MVDEEAGAAYASDMSCDVVIVGCGVAGLYTALSLPSSMDIVMLSKGAIEECDSMLAQGGICVLPDPADYDAYVEDTLRAGHYENRRESVSLMIRDSRDVINDLVACGVEFERDEAGELAFTREGAHSRPRICYHADITGEEITTKLLARVRALPNVRILEHTAMVDLIDAEAVPGEKAGCAGVVACHVDERDSTARATDLASGRAGDAGPRFAIASRACVLACGGIGGLYERSTNYPQLTGDACDIAAAHGAELEHMDYVQIHPTSLYVGNGVRERAFLISESCRGEGAILLNAAGERFCDELQPRDVVSEAIYRQMEEDGAPFVRLSFERVAPEVIRTHFSHIYEHCLERGYDICREPIPVVPAQHYFMGGIHVDRDSATCVPGLYAVGETSCTGVHGKNRLASNSLLEALVFARRAAYHMVHGSSLQPREIGEPPLDGRHRSCGIDGASIDEICKMRTGAPATAR